MSANSVLYAPDVDENPRDDAEYDSESSDDDADSSHRPPPHTTPLPRIGHELNSGLPGPGLLQEMMLMGGVQGGGDGGVVVYLPGDCELHVVPPAYTIAVETVFTLSGRKPRGQVAIAWDTTSTEWIGVVRRLISRRV
jgi:hypothetical protein